MGAYGVSAIRYPFIVPTYKEPSGPGIAEVAIESSVSPVITLLFLIISALKSHR